ncbi:MAG TPA: hypothetical protein VG367_03450 [Mucilaginibacter sp.]|jgi:hypothetical protein|nr:hypothetical protein [Mucilaginibacter sp.]
MKHISIQKDFGINDAGDEQKIREILNKINIDGQTEVSLDLSRCIVDYPATGILIDNILNQLSELDGEKRLIITVSYTFQEATLLNDMLGDSVFFGIVAKLEMPLSELLPKINDALIPRNIKMIVEISKSDSPKKEFVYGHI